MTGQHGAVAAALPPIHNDPIDRMLIGQGSVEGFILVTSDLAIANTQARSSTFAEGGGGWIAESGVGLRTTANESPGFPLQAFF